MRHTFFYVPMTILWISYLSLAVGIVSCIAFVVLLMIGFDFNIHRATVGMVLPLSMFSSGLYFSILASAVLYENVCRRADYRMPYLAPNRYGSWEDENFWSAQVINVGYLIIGFVLLTLSFFGVRYCLR